MKTDRELRDSVRGQPGSFVIENGEIRRAEIQKDSKPMRSEKTKTETKKEDK